MYGYIAVDPPLSSNFNVFYTIVVSVLAAGAGSFTFTFVVVIAVLCIKQYNGLLHIIERRLLQFNPRPSNNSIFFVFCLPHSNHTQAVPSGQLFSVCGCSLQWYARTSGFLIL
jgi:hypothetical protein